MNEFKNNRFILIIASIFLVGFTFFVLKELQNVLLPFFIAVIISIIFDPFYQWMKRKKIPSFVAIVIIVITILIISNLSSVFVFTSITSFKTEIPKYSEKIEAILVSLGAYINSFGITNEQIKESLNPANFVSGEKLTIVISDFISGIAEIFTNFVLILIYVVFLLAEIGSMKLRINKAFTPDRSEKITEILSDIFTDIKKYIVGKTFINLSHGIFITLLFWIFGLDFAIIWGVLTFLLAYIPNIGAFIATVLPFLTSLIQYDNLVTPFVLLILMALTGFIFGNVIEPRVLGYRLNLSPILILFSLIFWAYVWGIVGMILAVPVMSMIKIVLSKFESTRPISILMSYSVNKTDTVNQMEIDPIKEKNSDEIINN